jgi:hypothetical protein
MENTEMPFSLRAGEGRKLKPASAVGQETRVSQNESLKEAQAREETL